jgi:hypothetical protein
LLVKNGVAWKLAHSCHRGTNRKPNIDSFGVEPVQAMDIDAQIVGCDALAMKRVNAADFAEEVTRGFGVELIFAQGVLARQQPKFAFMNLDHERVFAFADGAIAHRQLWEICVDFKLNRCAVAAS